MSRIRRPKISPKHRLGILLEEIRVKRGLSKKDFCDFASVRVKRYNEFLTDVKGRGLAAGKLVQLIDCLEFGGQPLKIVDAGRYEAVIKLVEDLQTIKL
jgi:hypothetical protein